MSDTTALFDTASLGCAEALPVRTIDSSRDLGWTSALVEHQQALPSEDAFETRPTSDLTVVVMTHGAQELEVFRHGSWRYASYEPGTVGMTPGGTTDCLRRRIRSDAGDACKINLYIAPVFIAEAADHLARPGVATPSQPLDALGFADLAVRQTALAVLRAMRAGAPDIYVESAVRWLSLHLVMFQGNGSRASSEAQHQEAIVDKRLKRTLECIAYRYAEPLSLGELAAQAGVSKFHFARLFRRATGTTPYRYLVDRRLDAAKRMLKTTDLAIEEIARRSGFFRANHFSTQFSQRCGVSPREYRLAAKSTI